MRGIVVCLPIAAAAMAAWWFGGYRVATQYIAYALVLVAAGVWLIESLTRSVRAREFGVPTLMLPFVAALLLGIWHLSPADESLAMQMEHAELADLRPIVADGALPIRSLYPPATRLRLALIATLFLTWLICCEPLRSPGLLRFILAIVAVNGMCIAAYGLVRRAQGTEYIFESLQAQAGFSTFINRNQAAAFLNMSIAAGVGWFLLSSRDKGRSAPDGSAPIVRQSFSISRFLDDLTGEQLLAATSIAIMTAGVVLTYSRGGIGSLAISATAVAALATRRRGLAAACIVLSAGLAVALAMYLGEWSTVQTRLQSLSDTGTSWQGRFTHWNDTFGAVRDFPWTGTGWGTYAYANLPYQQHQMDLWYFNADNLYFEALVEGGIVGLTVFMLPWLLLLGAALRLCNVTVNREARTLAVVGLMAWISQAAQSTTDFGLLRPSNGLLFAVLMGLVCSEAISNVRLKPPGRWLTLGSLPGGTRIAFGVACIGVASLGTWEFARAAECATAVEEASELISSTTPEDAIALIDGNIDDLKQALAGRPDDAEARLKLAELWIHKYRLTAFEELRSQPEITDHLTEAMLWHLSHPSTLQRVFMMHVDAYGLEAGESIREATPVIANLRPAVEQLQLARRVCPVSRQIDYWCAMLGMAFPEDPDGERSISRSVFANPARSTRLMDLGQLAWNAYHEDLAVECFRRALTLSSLESYRAWSVMRERIDDDEIVTTLLPGKVDVLLQIADRLDEDDPAVSLIARRLVEVSQAAPVEPSQQGEIAALSGDYAGAIEAYRLALAERPEDIPMRVKLVRCHVELGDFEGARGEIRLALSYSPGNAALLDLKQEVLDAEHERN